MLKVISRSTFDLQTVLDTLVESAVRLCEAERGLLFRRDGEIYKSVAYYNYSREFREFHESHPITPGRGTTVGRMALEGKAVQIVDVLSDPEYTFTEAQKLGQGRATLAVPLLREANPVGALALQRTEPRAYSGKQIELVETFADQAVIALENARLLNELRESSSSRPPPPTCSRSSAGRRLICRQCSTHWSNSAACLCDADSAAIHRPKGDFYPFVASFGYSREYEQYMRDHPITPGHGVLGRTLHECKVIQMEDVQADADYSLREQRSIGGYRTILGLPLLREGVPIGVLIVTRSQVRLFTDKQIELISTFADQAVIAIENVLLFEEVQARTRELSESLEQQTATSEVLSVISSSAGELQPVFETMLAKAVALCDASFGAMWLVDGDGYRTAALHGDLPEAYIEQWRSGTLHHPKAVIPMVRAIQSRKPVHVPDMLKDTGLPRARSAGGECRRNCCIRTLLTVPMLKEDEAIGVVTIYRKEVRSFTKSRSSWCRISPLKPLSRSRTRACSTNCANRFSNRRRLPKCSDHEPLLGRSRTGVRVDPR